MRGKWTSQKTLDNLMVKVMKELLISKYRNIEKPWRVLYQYQAYELECLNLELSQMLILSTFLWFCL